MLDSILNGLKDQVAGELLSKAGIDENQIDDVINVAGESAQEVMADKLTPDNLEGVINLFSKGSNSSLANNIQGDFINNYVAKLISKIGLSESTARSIAAIAIPKIIELITGENEKTPPSDVSSLINMLGGKNSGSLEDKLGGMLGGFLK